VFAYYWNVAQCFRCALTPHPGNSSEVLLDLLQAWREEQVLDRRLLADHALLEFVAHDCFQRLGGIIPVGGVLSNALASALSSLGVQPRELPLTPPRVWQWIRESGADRFG
jgi:hypothetical protein